MNQTQLQQRIRSLPKEIQILIDEYNVEHRPKFYKILSIFKKDTPYCYECVVCEIKKIGFVLYSHSVSDFVCSKKCLENI